MIIIFILLLVEFDSKKCRLGIAMCISIQKELDMI